MRVDALTLLLLALNLAYFPSLSIFLPTLLPLLDLVILLLFVQTSAVPI